MRKIRLNVPIVPSVNSLYATFRGRRILSRKGREYKKNVGVAAFYEKMAQKWELSRGEKLIMELRFFWPDKRRRDCSNGIKCLEDTFTGILYEDDSFVLPHVLDYSLDRERPRVEVLIYPKEIVEVKKECEVDEK